MTLPASVEELSKLTDDLTREIDAQYVVTYRPKKAVMLGSTEEIRRIEVVSRRVGLHVRSRRSYLRALPVRPWVFAIAKRVFLMHVRKVRRRESPEATNLSVVAEPQAAVAGEHVALRVELADALNHIPVDGRRAFLLHHWRGLSFREIAAMLGIGPGAAKLRSSRAATRLRRLLQREIGGPGD